MKATRTCSVDGCEKRHHSGGLCQKHYWRWKAHGDPMAAVRAYGRVGCKIDGCDRPHYRSDYCQRHNRRFKLYGDPLHSEPMGAAKTPMMGPANPSWKNGDITYFTAHQRVAASRGRASAHLCHDCGERASQWSYTHECPNELVDDRGYAYSGDPDRYTARCIPCHAAFDAARRRMR